MTSTKKIRWGWCAAQGILWGLMFCLYAQAAIEHGVKDFFLSVAAVVAIAVPVLGCIPVSSCKCRY